MHFFSKKFAYIKNLLYLCSRFRNSSNHNTKKSQIMKTIHLFKISEDSEKFDVVEMLYDNLEECYIVRWKWTTMKDFWQQKFERKRSAKEFYIERKGFAINCN